MFMWLVSACTRLNSARVKMFMLEAVPGQSWDSTYGMSRMMDCFTWRTENVFLVGYADDEMPVITAHDVELA